MAAVSVDPARYEAASACLGHDVAGGLADAIHQLGRSLEGSQAMAGHDSGGVSWGQHYDLTAGKAVDTLAVVHRASVTMARLLQRCGLNHGIAEADSMSAHRIDVLDRADYATVAPIYSTCGVVPVAGGGSSDYPFGWELVRALVGFEWPDGRTDRLHSAAEAWATAGETIDGLTSSVDRAVAALREERSPEVSDAVVVCQGLRRHLTTLAVSCTAMASSCRDFAHGIDSTRQQAEDALETLVVTSAITEFMGGLLSVVTFGLAEGPTQAAEAAEIAGVAARVRILLSALAERCSGFVASIASRNAALDGAEQAAAVIADADVVAAETAMVEQTGAVETGLTATEKAEAAAARKLAGDAESAGNGAWRDPTQVENHFVRHGQDFSAKTPQEYTEMAQKLLKRSREEGLPTKVDQDGTIRVYDPASNSFGSYTSDGLIRTFFKPSSPTYWQRQPGELQ